MSVLARIFKPNISMRNETSNLSSPAQWLIDALGGTKSMSGEVVNSKTAMGIIAYFACIRNIAEDIGKLPRHVYKNIKPRGRDIQSEHPADRLIHDSPNPEMSAMTFHETLTAHALGWKGGYAEIIKRGDGKPTALWPIDPHSVTEVRLTNGDLRYRVQAGAVPDVFLRPDQVIHIHGLGYDGITGYVLSYIAKESLGGAMARRNFNSSFFANGTKASGILKLAQALSEPALQRLRESWTERYSGSENSGKTVILEEGMDFVPISADAEESQMVETLDFDVEEIARLFRMPPNKLGHFKRAQGWSTVEMLNIDYVVDCIMSWATRWEQEYQRKLFPPSERDLYVKFNFNALLRGDSKTRSENYQRLWQLGVLSQNDIRELEDMNPVEHGDSYFVPLNFVPSDIAELGPQEAEPEPAPEPTPTEPAKVENHITVPAPVVNNIIAPPAPQPIATAPEIDPVMRFRQMSALVEPMLAKELDSLLKREESWAQKARKAKATFELKDDHTQYVTAEFGRLFDMMAVSTCPESDFAAEMHELARLEARAHVEQSRTESSSVARLVTWVDGSRARAQANGIMDSLISRLRHLKGGLKCNK